MRNGFMIAGIAFAITLAVIVGTKLSSEALAVVAGAVCGIAASIPVSLGLMIASSKHWGREEGYREIGYDYGTHRYTPQPPMVFIAPQPMPSPYGYAPNAQNMQYLMPPSAPTMGAPREFKIIGDE